MFVCRNVRVVLCVWGEVAGFLSRGSLINDLYLPPNKCIKVILKYRQFAKRNEKLALFSRTPSPQTLMALARGIKGDFCFFTTNI